MNEPSLIGRQRLLLRDLASIAAEKAQAEPALAASFRAEKESADKALAEGRHALDQRFRAAREALDEEQRQQLEAINSRTAADQEAAQKEHAAARWELISRFDAEKEEAESAVQEARWAADAVLEGKKNEAAAKLRENNARLAARIEELAAIHQESRALLEEWEQPVSELEARAQQSAQSRPGQLRKITECIQEVETYRNGLRELVAPRFLKGNRLLGLTLLLGLVWIFPFGWLATRLLGMGDSLGAILGLGPVVSIVVSALGWLIARTILKSRARTQVEALYVPLCVVLVEAETTRQLLLKRYQAEHDQTVAEGQRHHERERARAEGLEKKLPEVATRRAAAFAQLEERLHNQRSANDQRRAADLRKVEQRHKRGQERALGEHETAVRQLEAEHRARLDDLNTRHLREWQLLLEKWQRKLTSALKNAAAIQEESDDLFPPWDDEFWRDWRPPTVPPDVLRLGSLQVKAEAVVESAPWEEGRPNPAPSELCLPALCPFTEPPSLLLHAEDEGRQRAVEALQTVMFRQLTSLPPGRVRFLIVDPVGLGQNFAAFMSLADYDEALVGARIWTEPVHIEHRLADLTAHMENVIQKYLRNRYATISDYNAQAGEVAEPFRVLVVANFPANFTAEAARRLVSIAQSGPRCGVSTLISVDRKQPLPKGLDLADLERCAANLVWEQERFRWRDEDFGRLPLTLDRLPEREDFANRILQQVGEGARNAQRVEVPFEFIAPPQARRWTGSTRLGIAVALGRAGATRRQELELGKGTSQHVLVVGKTGSGKSTLMHALITNLGLLYSPDEIELYLVDFKKGVEFKTYATHQLPHARVVAIESEREFGLSVLQRLDAELKTRGERFRAAGAQDVNAYRQAVPEARAPRILLIVDEFQEFFVEDDRITQEAAQLLDRLVRQGRAFGMHVLLGSQTLGGAYSLARSTIDQMAVRIALQCSEVDAHLILSDDNSAARLLSRPGEAIYNDANGLVEGNDPFQVVWLGDAQREQYLTGIHELDRTRRTKERLPTVVFEGNASADVSKNHLLNRLLTGPVAARAEPFARPEEAWLGEAMAIDQLTSAVFQRRNGSNLLIVGQQPETALGMLVTGVIGLSAHASPAAPGMPRFFIVDGHQADAPRAGVLANLPEVLAEPVRVVGWRELPGVLAEMSAELDRRQKAPSADAPAIYLVLYGLQRMRDLRRQEDDFGFSSRGEEQPARPDKQLAALLREGAGLGMHTLVWCDTLNNLQRAFDRQTMRELAMRVVFQLSVADSSNLIDSPAASKLGPHRALFANEEDGRLEKFRPYGAPAEEWLSWARTELRKGRAKPQAAQTEAACGFAGRPLP
jgi:hypothetical protein